MPKSFQLRTVVAALGPILALAVGGCATGGGAPVGPIHNPLAQYCNDYTLPARIKALHWGDHVFDSSHPLIQGGLKIAFDSSPPIASFVGEQTASLDGELKATTCILKVSGLKWSNSVSGDGGNAWMNIQVAIFGYADYSNYWIYNTDFYLSDGSSGGSYLTYNRDIKYADPNGKVILSLTPAPTAIDFEQ